MIQEDRRKHPRFPVLLRCTLVTARDRRDAVCTQIGPAGAFLTGRLDHLQPGEIVHVEMRSGGLGTPMVSLLALIVRVASAGLGNPPGVAMRWRAAACDLGAEPLVQFLTQVLRLPRAPHIDLTSDRHAEFDIEASLAGQDVQVVSTYRGASPRSPADTARLNAQRHSGQLHRAVTPEAPPPRPGSAQRADYSLLDDPLLRPHATAAAQGQQTRRSDTFIAVPPRPPSGLQSAAPAAPQPAFVLPQPSPTQLGVAEGPVTQSGQPVSTSLRPSRVGIPVANAELPSRQMLPASSRSSSAIAVVLPPVDRSRMPRTERTPALGWKPPAFSARGENTNLGDQSGAPLALGGGEHSASFDIAGEAPVSSAGSETVSFPVYALAPAERRPETQQNRQSPAREAGEFGAQDERTDLTCVADVPVGQTPRAAPISSVTGKSPSPVDNFNPTVMLRANHAVRFSVGAKLHSGRAVAIGGQAVAVVTHEGAPELDQPVIVFLPIDSPDGPMVIDLRGKLLQVITETEAGPRFVMHIERVDEGYHTGAYHRFLRSLAG